MTTVSTARDGKASVLYDGDCAFCRKSVSWLGRLDWLRRLRFLNAREPANIPAHEPPLETAKLLDEMHLVTADGTGVYHGFGAFRWMAWRLPLLFWIAPFLYIPGIPSLGQKAYLWVARNRFNLVPCKDGVCSIHRPK